jgi:hypothetical protein
MKNTTERTFMLTVMKKAKMLVPVWLSLVAITAQGQTEPTTNTQSAENQESQDKAPESIDQPSQQDQASQSKGHVARALLTTGIVDREPVDEIVSLDNDAGRVYFFTEFVNMKGANIVHRWEYKGKTMAEVNFNVASPKWRSYSSKNIKPEWTGIWSVYVVGEDGKVLKESVFEVLEDKPMQ